MLFVKPNLLDKEIILCLYSISILTEMLKDKNFFRCNNHYLINIGNVEYFDNRIVRVHGEDILVDRKKMRTLQELVAKSVNIFF